MRRGGRFGERRAEGETEMIGKITVKCRGLAARDADDALTLGTSAPKKLEISVTLNTDVTNDRGSNDMIDSMAMAPGYDSSDVMLTANTLNAAQVVVTGSEIDIDGADDTLGTDDDQFSAGAVSDDLRTVTWKHTDSDGATDGVQGLENCEHTFRRKRYSKC